MATEDPTAERWLPIQGYEGLYEVSDFGRVRRLDTRIATKGGATKRWNGRILIAKPRGNGYVRITLHGNSKSKTHSVHRLVLCAFLRNPTAGEVANHIDFNRTNNCIDNLEWTTQKGNVHHAIAAGRFHVSRGEASGGAKLTTDGVIDIRRRVANGERQTDIASEYGVSKVAICQVVGRSRWAHVP